MIEKLTMWNEITVFIYLKRKTKKDYFGSLKGALSGLTQFVAAERPLKKIKNVFYVALKALFVLKTLKFLF